MDVTPQELRGSEIKEAFRGYHRDEVDDLLERAAVTIENLTRQVQEAPAARPAGEAPLVQVSRNDAETIQRTLLLAQRAADDAIAEAQERARQILDESEAKAQTLVGEAEVTARRIHEGERRRLEAEIAVLIERRARLQTDADALEAYASGYRDRVRAAIESDLANLGGAIEAPGERPELSEADVVPVAPAPVPEAAPVSSYSWDDEPATRAINLIDAEAESPAPAPAPAPAPIVAPAQPPSAPPAAVAPPTPTGPAAAPAPAEAEWPPPAPTAQSSIAVDTHAPWEPPAAMPESLAPESYGDSFGAGQPFSSDVAMEAQAVDSDVLDDDAFFASLRDAVRDDEPLGPVDDGLPESSSFFDDAQPEEPSRRFRRR